MALGATTHAAEVTGLYPHLMSAFTDYAVLRRFRSRQDLYEWFVFIHGNYTKGSLLASGLSQGILILLGTSFQRIVKPEYREAV